MKVSILVWRQLGGVGWTDNKDLSMMRREEAGGCTEATSTSGRISSYDQG